MDEETSETSEISETPATPATSETSMTTNERSRFLQTMLSVLAAGIGIQSNKNSEQDFEQSNFKIIVFAGLIGVALFIFTLVTLVSYIVDQQ
ncbi:MAG: DUF2970 domain-containing protein [Pseudomonadales bacterium]|nr:DUF2970 domain-containing protein [Pseudomonadales bacterium]